MTWHYSQVKKENLKINFQVTDFENQVGVSYTGIIPDLFREGQGVVAIGTLGEDGIFIAHTILAKHDEKYMPREISDMIKKSKQP